MLQAITWRRGKLWQKEGERTGILKTKQGQQSSKNASDVGHDFYSSSQLEEMFVALKNLRLAVKKKDSSMIWSLIHMKEACGSCV